MSTSADPPRAHPVLDALHAIDTALNDLADGPLWTLSEPELLTALDFRS
jgi:hypothetical protein